MRSPKRASAEPPVGGTITSLVAKRGATDRLVVYLDGARAFELAVPIADAEPLRARDHLDAREVQRLIEKDAPYRARERALKFIAVRDRSCHEVESRLSRAGFDAEVVAGAIAWLRDLGYVDDQRFAAHYVAEKLRGGWGDRRIASELGRLGVDRHVVTEALQEAEAAFRDDSG